MSKTWESRQMDLLVCYAPLLTLSLTEPKSRVNALSWEAAHDQLYDKSFESLEFLGSFKTFRIYFRSKKMSVC